MKINVGDIILWRNIEAEAWEDAAQAPSWVVRDHGIIVEKRKSGEISRSYGKDRGKHATEVRVFWFGRAGSGGWWDVRDVIANRHIIIQKRRRKKDDKKNFMESGKMVI